MKPNSVKKKKASTRRRAAKTDRSADVLQVAGELFLLHGYEGVSLEMIVSRTGGSYREIYKEFGPKKALFLRVITESCEEVLAPLRSALNPGEHQPPRPLEEAMLNMCRDVLRVLLSPRSQALTRLIISEALRFPDLAKRFFEIGPNTAYKIVAEFLAARSESDDLHLGDPFKAAVTFVDSFVHNLEWRGLIGHVITRTDIDVRTRAAVRIFLRGVQPSPANHSKLPVRLSRRRDIRARTG